MNEVEAAEPGSGAAWGGTGETAATGAPGAPSGRPGLGDRRPWMLQWTLSRIAGALGLLGLVFVAATIAVLAFEQRERGERETRQDLQDTAFFLADHAARLFEVSDVVLRSATAKIEGATWEEIAASEDLFRRLRAAKEPVPYVEDVWLNDANGDLRLTTFAFPSPRSNASDREPFRFHRQPNDRLHVGERIVDRDHRPAELSPEPPAHRSRRIVPRHGVGHGGAVLLRPLLEPGPPAARRPGHPVPDRRQGRLGPERRGRRRAGRAVSGRGRGQPARGFRGDRRCGRPAPASPRTGRSRTSPFMSG